MSYSILKKAKKCQKCGQLMQPGEAITWVHSDVPLFMSNGQIVRRKTVWTPKHAMYDLCQLASFDNSVGYDQSKENWVETLEIDIKKLEKQIERLDTDDKSVEPLLQRQIDGLENKMAEVKQLKTSILIS